MGYLSDTFGHVYLTSLREFNKITGHNKQAIRKGDVVIIHDDKPRLQWKLAVVEDLIKGNDGLIRAAHIRTDNVKTTRPIVKLYPLEVNEGDDGEVTPGDIDRSRSQNRQGNLVSDDTAMYQTTTCVRRRAATKALQRMTEWTDTLRLAPENVEN